MKNLVLVACFVLLKLVASEDNATTTITPATATSTTTASTVTTTTTTSTTPEIVVTTTVASSSTPDEIVTTTIASSTNESTTYSYADLPVKDGKVVLTNEEWKKRLTEEQYRVTRESGTERSFTGSFYNNKKNGTYTCVCCGQELFSSEHKFDSGTGWPSYYQPIRNESIVNIPDNSHGMKRTETQCSRCNAHLGHLFTDGPKPTGLRYCINSVSLNFVETK